MFILRRGFPLRLVARRSSVVGCNARRLGVVGVVGKCVLSCGVGDGRAYAGSAKDGKGEGLRSVGLEGEERLGERRGEVYGDYLIAPGDLQKFLDHAVGGMSPDGRKPSYPLLTKEEMGLLQVPYKDWAPAPYNTLDHSCMDRISPIFEDPEGTRSAPPFWARLNVLRKKMWHGMVPLTRERWFDKKMDDPRNYRMMMELMQDILTVFTWLNSKETLDCTRGVYNRLVDAHVEFEGAVNLLREGNGQKERVNMAGTWAEFYQAMVSTMTERTHQWLVARVGEIQSRAFAEYTQTIEEKQEDTEAIAQASKIYYECVQDLNAMITKTDYVLGVPMTGFKGYTPSNSAFDLPLELRRDTYARIAETKQWNCLSKIMDAQKRDGPEKPQNITDLVDEMKNGLKPAAPRFQDTDAFLGHYHEGVQNRAEIRKALRGEPRTLGEEHWITILKERMAFYLQHGQSHETWNHNWGFVCYRLTYQQSNSEWSTFWQNFGADAFRIGSWIQGYDSIEAKATIHIIDGRDVGIPEGDVQAAKNHFSKTYTTLPTLGRIWTGDFLVVDLPSYTSHTVPQSDPRPPPPYAPSFGDNGGFVTLVDTMEYAPEVIDITAPGYTGSVRVLSSLLFEEVYPLLADHAVRPMALWSLARGHPRGVFVGHVVGGQESWWEFGSGSGGLVRGFLEYLEGKKGGMGDGEL